MKQYKTDLLDIRCMDCMELMAQYPDKHFDLAIVDPPYGIGADKAQNNTAKRRIAANGTSKSGRGWKLYKETEWDASPPCADYFGELFRVSKNQIIWGANYYPQHLQPSMGWVFWDKGQREFSLADGELAFTSFKKALRVFEYSRGAALAEGERIHPTQKPVALYSWLLAKYAKPGDTILDTHMGSGSIAIACHYAGHHLTACELDEEYFDAACERITNATKQTTLDFTALPT